MALNKKFFLTAISLLFVHAVLPLCVFAGEDVFIRGFDASGVDYSENEGGDTYRDTDGSKIDFFEILKNHGVNTVRLRLWVDPKKAQDGTVASDVWNGESYTKAKYTYDTTLERVIRMSKRAKAAGLKIILDFHYSDFWADPAKQIIPYSWQNINTADAMAEKISEYTTSVLNALNAQGVVPEYVQIGNEIDTGLLTQNYFNAQAPSKTRYANSSVGGKMSSSPNSNFAKYLTAGAKATKDFNSNIKVILHVTNISNSTSANLIKAMSKNAQLYDIIGLSYYPWEASHRNISALKGNINSIRAAGKEALVVETSMLCASGDSEKLSNVTKHMIDPATKKLYADLETSGGKVRGSVENQKKVLAHIMKEVADAGGIGVCTWGGQRTGDTTWGMFSANGKALESIDAFNTNATVSTKAAASGITATNVLIQGGWDNWKKKSAMKETSSGSNVYTFTVPGGNYEFGFFLDGTWYSDDAYESGKLAPDGEDHINCETCAKGGSHTIMLDLNAKTWKCE